VFRHLLALLFVTAGALHFVIPDVYVKIMPPYLPYHRGLVYLSGACEIIGGLAVLVPALRRAAGYGLIALLVAVFPANVHHLTANVAKEGMTPFSWLLVARLPVQLLLVAWVYWCTLAPERRAA
jgi:uncharacterized membrane protein